MRPFGCPLPLPPPPNPSAGRSWVVRGAGACLRSHARLTLGLLKLSPAQSRTFCGAESRGGVVPRRITPCIDVYPHRLLLPAVPQDCFALTTCPLSATRCLALRNARVSQTRVRDLAAPDTTQALQQVTHQAGVRSRAVVSSAASGNDIGLRFTPRGGSRRPLFLLGAGHLAFSLECYIEVNMLMMHRDNPADSRLPSNLASQVFWKQLTLVPKEGL